MPFMTYTPPNKQVNIGTDENPNYITVEALNSNRISLLVQSLQDDLEAIFNLASMLTKTDLDKLTNIDLQLGDSFFKAAIATPTVVSTAIAICVVGEDAGEPVDKRIVVANSLPLSLQAKIISAILELTFAEVGAIKKLIDQFAVARVNLNPK